MTPDYGEKEPTEQVLPFGVVRPTLRTSTTTSSQSWFPLVIRYFFAASIIFLLGFFYAHATLSTTTVRCQLFKGGTPGSCFLSEPQDPQNTAKQALCTQREYETGHWEPIAPVNVTEEILDFEDTLPNPYGVSWHWCAPMPDIKSAGGGRWDNGRWDDGERTEEEDTLEGERRSIEVNAWGWVPDLGKECMVEWNAIDLVVRLLKSPGGLILVGDSITRQHYHSIMHLIASAGIEYESNLPSLPMAGHKNVNQHTLNPSSPSTAMLLSLAKVPKSRISRPFVTYLEDHLFIGEADIREITYRFGAEEGYKWWYDFQRVEDWEKFVQDAARPRYGEVESVTEDTVVLLNTGPHWARNDINMLPKNKLPEEHARLRGCYAAMVDKVSARLSPTPQLTVIYRATSPGHPGCRNRRSPYLDARSALYHETNVRQRLLDDSENDKVRSGREVWDWDLFLDHNDAWRRKIHVYNKQRDRSAVMRSKGATKHGAIWLYLDIWEMSLQRPDAHNEPTDCLHWCMPVVLNEWTHLLHHVLHLQGQKMERAKGKAEPDSTVPIQWD